MTNKEIQSLIQILKREPKKSYKRKYKNNRCNLSLSGEKNDEIKFDVFIRQNQEFIENFSIGLIYKTSGFPNGLHLIRYNGPHDSKTAGHLKPHIHKMTEKDIHSGSSNPKPTKREETNKYNTFEEELEAFFADMKIINWKKYFPELEQGRLI